MPARKTKAAGKPRGGPASPPKLSDTLRAEVIVRHACFETPTEIQAWLQEAHGIAMGLPGIIHYDYDRPLARVRAPAKWTELFDRARAQFSENITAVPIANARVRLAIIQRRIDHILSRGAANKGVLNDMTLIDYVELAAKDAGGAFTNRRESTEFPIDLQACSAEQLERIARGEHPARVLADTRPSGA